MPCGPLQAMQVYALSTGSFMKGALSMFLFCLGTILLMLSIGLLFTILKGKWKIIVNKIAAVFILILSLSMFNWGLLSFKIDLFQNHQNESYVIAQKEGDIQVVEFTLSINNYQDIILEKDIPVKIIIHVDKEKLTGCNNKIVMQDFNIEKELKVGENSIEFIPKKLGMFSYTCWMNMIKNNIQVVENIDKLRN